ncbi:hypothetical protein SLEP1_g27622 [Rubroshorea leprosula]|uniref:Gag protein n=1 Tax=Rubroshorea leprosula TaxID=152421 RepID=A0AAV5K0C5_9ROSI|nr:hypothetical protein SLEP1_g27622 [Rubroshorea leprosula]
MSWKAQILSLLRGYELDGFIDGTHPCPIATEPTYSFWARQDQLLHHAFLTSISEAITPYIAVATIAQQAWETLVKLYANRSQTRVITLKERLQTMKRDGHSFSEYLRSLKTVVDELGSVDLPLTDDDLTVYVLNGLGPGFREIVASLHTHDSSLSFDDLHDRLVAYEESLKRDDLRINSAPITAHYANIPGPSHLKCRNQGLRTSNRPAGLTCQLCKLDGHFATNCPNFRVQALRPMAHAASSSAAILDDCLLDSSANHHVTIDLANLALH